MTANEARSAGGGIYYSGSGKSANLTVTKSTFSRNAVQQAQSQSDSEDGVGGAIYLGRSNFTLTDLQLTGNAAYYGGGMFISANLQQPAAELSNITASGNKAVAGSSVFWLRSASPDAELPVDAFNITPDGTDGAIATEVITVNYTTQPPDVVQSAENVNTFSVALLDYYGHVGASELGSCQVTSPNTTTDMLGASAAAVEAQMLAELDDQAPAPGPAMPPAPAPSADDYDGNGGGDIPSAGNDTLTIRPLGAEVGVGMGVAVFSQLEITGMIGQSYNLQVDCTPNSLGRSRYLQLSGESLPALDLPVTVAPCQSGREPKMTSSGALCVECPYNTFNFDGEACQNCPKGALCPGGDQISSQQNWWRSSYNSTQFYACRTPDVCNAGPAAGDAACVEGAEGPLCAVCKPDWFAFAGKCNNCNKSGQAKAMLAFTVILIVVILVLIFWKSWEFGPPGQPGVLTKLKILITHFQILALFRDYDVLWPSVSAQGFSWFDTFNVGLGMMAPSCFFGSGYSFWAKWIIQMLLPVGAVSLCMAVYFLAHKLLKWHMQRIGGDGAARAAGAVPYTKNTPPAEQQSTEATATLNGATSTAIQPEVANAVAETDGPPEASAPDRLYSEAIPADKVSKWLYDLKIRCWKNAFWLVTLLYPRSSMTALQMFATQTLDIGTFLTADYSIKVKQPGGGYTATYIRYMIPGAIMLFIFAVVVPGFYFLTIWRNRKSLDDPLVAKKYGFLYGSYKRKHPYWETIESLRKFFFAFIPVFVPPNSDGSMQGTVGQILACGTLIATVWLMPFAKNEDNYLQIASMAGESHALRVPGVGREG